MDDDFVEYTFQNTRYRVDARYAAEMEHTVTDVMGELIESLDEDPLDENLPVTDPPSGAPFCGCETCTTREMMVMLIGMIISGMSDGKISVPDDVPDQWEGHVRD